MVNKEIKVAIIDLYNNEINEGIRCIKEIVSESNCNKKLIPVNYDRFETRYKDEVPDLRYDIFISSGGPGSPFEGVEQKWEHDYFSLVDKIWNYNQNGAEKKKYIFFICHSFQLMARYFKFAEVNARHEKSFGVLPFRRTDEGKNDPILKNLSDPFYAADFRQYQVVQKNQRVLDQLGGKILALELEDEEKRNESAIMALRISDEIVGTQFHPEADPMSMLYHLRQDERKNSVIEKSGEDKYFEMLAFLEDPDKLKLTRESVLPAFLESAIESLSEKII
ncbi:MAG: type 1 glutamine amidotransferase [Ignavibacteriaceae bacterium]